MTGHARCSVSGRSGSVSIFRADPDRSEFVSNTSWKYNLSIPDRVGGGRVGAGGERVVLPPPPAYHVYHRFPRITWSHAPPVSHISSSVSISPVSPIANFTYCHDSSYIPSPIRAPMHPYTHSHCPSCSPYVMPPPPHVTVIGDGKCVGVCMWGMGKGVCIMLTWTTEI